MLLILLDEPTLFVFDSVETAIDYIEPIDAEGEIRAAFDHTGVPYRAEWIRPNRQSSAVLGVKVVEQGEYRLVPAGPAAPADLLALLEAHTTHIDPPDARAEVESLAESLRGSR